VPVTVAVNVAVAVNVNVPGVDMTHSFRTPSSGALYLAFARRATRSFTPT
jgi:hypothetical protein